MKDSLQCFERKKVKAKLLSRVRLCDPMDCSLPGSSLHGILQARVLEWGAIFLLHYSALQFSKVLHTQFHIIPNNPFLIPYCYITPPSLSPTENFQFVLYIHGSSSKTIFYSLVCCISLQILYTSAIIQYLSLSDLFQLISLA